LLSRELRVIVNKYHVFLKSKITSFLIGYRRKYEKFPMKELNSLSRHHSYNLLSTLIIKGKKVDYVVALKETKTTYNSLKKKINPSYFNPYLRAYLKDANKCKSESDIKIVYKTYERNLDKEFKEMDKDLDFCIRTLKEVNIKLREANKKK